MRIRGIDHLVLRVADLARAIDFYVRVLGCQVERRQEDIGLVQLRAGSALIDLVATTGTSAQRSAAAAGGDGRNLDHFCLAVDQFDPQDAARRLEDSGVKVQGFGSRYGAKGEGISFYIEDPDGNQIELRD
jgi:catechol 2,3-dioxygenase-like lactoylglutathione lyase family enzyme